MRDHGILIGTDGPFHNVLKIRPPMPFNDEDAALLTATLAEVMEVIRAGPEGPAYAAET